ncbi:MAG: Ca2+-binding EF-hand superfamily protein [Chlamydiales bacterium]|jgi:Ca2+-binding EF-hand superfamily protein
MRTSSRLALPSTLILSAALLTVACRTHDAAVELPASSPSGTPTPVALEGQTSIWVYIASRYDADFDGFVQRWEYDRGAFEQLDRDQDGALTAADFESDPSPESTRMMTAMVGESLLGQYFQADDQPAALGVGELERVMRAYDTDDDGRIDAGEFGCAAGAQAAFGRTRGGGLASMLDVPDPWGGLRSAIDDDADEALGDGEIFAFFESLDEDADGELSFDPETEWTEDGSPVTENTSGPAAGLAAPDFELPYDRGSERVRLSSFRGDRPVALIFGSYT